MIIAVDGPAASGKGTLARRLAAHFGLRHLDTGLLYRAVARQVLAAGGDLSDPAARLAAAHALDPADLDATGLRSQAMGEAASIIAADQEVRRAILAFQRDFAQAPPGAVLDGRDIGTVVCPDADVKLFVIASAEERARRRHAELSAAGENVAYKDVLSDIRARDARDTSRTVAPLKPATDALLLDTTELDIEAAFRAAVDMIGGS
jgi:CMP/dCMP kinase